MTISVNVIKASFYFLIIYCQRLLYNEIQIYRRPRYITLKVFAILLVSESYALYLALRVARLFAASPCQACDGYQANYMHHEI